MIRFLKKYWPIILITFFAFFLRIYKLGQFPVGFLWDEAALGYNSYSILKTGRDEYGQLFPVIFKSLGDYKPGLYVYLTVPSIILFGLNEFAVRLPSAVFGTLTVLIMYLLIRNLYGFTRIKKRISSDSFALVTSFLLSISPWHINFSRGAWELNIMLFEITLGILLLVKFFNHRKKFFLHLSAIAFISALFTYQAAKFLVPVLMMGLIYCFRKKFSSLPKSQKVSYLAIFVMGYLLLSLLTFGGGKAGRLKVMSLFSYPRLDTERSMILTQDNGNEILFNFFHGQAVFFTRSILGRYFNYFSGRFLFIEGDWSNPRNGTVYQGVLYYLDLIFLIWGLGILFAKDRNPFENFVLFWLIIAPLPGALTRDSISSVRSFSMAIPLIFIISVGINYWMSVLKNKKILVRFPIYCLVFTGYCLLFTRFLHLYFVHDGIFSSKSRLYGYKETVDYIKPKIGEKTKVIFTNKYGQPYIFYLFYSTYDPKKYQKQAKLKENLYGDVGEIEKIDNIEFRKIYFPNDRAIPDALLIGDEYDLPILDITQEDQRFRFIKEIKFLDGKTAFRIVETSPSSLDSARDFGGASKMK